MKDRNGEPRRVISPRQWHGLAAVTGLAVVVLVVNIAVGSRDHRAPSPAPAAGLRVTTGPAGDGTRVVSQRGLTLNVPSTWKDNNQRCGRQLGDTVAFGIEAEAACLDSRPQSAFTLVQFQTTAHPQQHCSAPEHTGLSACTERNTDPLGRTVVVVSVPANNESVIINALDPRRAKFLAATARIAVSVDGCEVKPATLDPRPPQHDGAKEALLPGDPLVLTACSYIDRLLMTTGSLKGTRLASLATTLNSLDTGLGSAAQNYSREACKTTIGNAIHLIVGYSGSPPLDIWLHVDGCSKNVGFDNGARTAFPSLDAYTALFKVITVQTFDSPESLHRQ